jgi:hypothetical protein
LNGRLLACWLLLSLLARTPPPPPLPMLLLWLGCPRLPRLARPASAALTLLMLTAPPLLLLLLGRPPGAATLPLPHAGESACGRPRQPAPLRECVAWPVTVCVASGSDSSAATGLWSLVATSGADRYSTQRAGLCGSRDLVSTRSHHAGERRGV